MIFGAIESFERAQPSADGLRTSNVGCNSSRIESTSWPSAQKKDWSARRSPGAHRTVKLRSPAKNAETAIPS